MVPVLVMAGTIVGCGGQASVGNSAKTPGPIASVHWKQITAPQGVDIPGAEWLEIRGAGGDPNNLQTAAVLRPQGSGPFPLVVWLHGGEGFHVGDVTRAAPLTAAGLMVLVGCWQSTPTEPTLYLGQSFPTIPCLHIHADSDSEVDALIGVGQQLPEVQKHAIGLFGVSAGGPEALGRARISRDIRVVVVDSTLPGPDRVSVPVLMLGATADNSVSIQTQQNYEETLLANRTRVESHYYEGGGHAVTYFGAFVDDAMRRTADFFLRYLST
jgi:dienelactone hydrolase